MPNRLASETSPYLLQHKDNPVDWHPWGPDVDAVYMEAVQGMTGHGGWPLTAFLDPDGVPFYGGTYFPPEPRQGMPSLRMVMEAVVESWGTQRERIRAAARRIREQ